MKDYEASTYGDAIADRYDSWFSEVEPSMIDRLGELAAGGKALELGIGTGRVALPLRERGVEVHGIDASRAMVRRLREKKGGSEIPVSIGTFSSFETEERFDLVFVVFNTFFVLLSQQQQLDCFESVSRALAPQGRFVIEAFVPDPGRFEGGQSVRAVHVSANQTRIESSLHDRATQTVSTQLLDLGEQGVRLRPVKLRYAWPAEIDLMARLHGMRLVDRWGGWRGEPYTSDSSVHVSVYRLEE